MSENTIPVFEDARSAALVAPLSPDPVGADVRSTPTFEELETEVRRIDTEGPAAVRWDRVGQTGLEILSSQGRDLLVACWTTYALCRTEGWRGLAVGVDCISAMVKQWWDDFLPKRERARVGALEWLVVRLTPIIAEMPVENDDVPALSHASALLEELNLLLPEKLTKERIAFGDLVRAVRVKAQEGKDILARAEKAEAEEAAKAAAAAASPAESRPEPAPAAPSAPPSSAASAPTAPPPQIAEGISGPELDRAIGALSLSMRQHAQRLRDANLADPRSYRLTRAATWLEINALPEAKDKATQLFPPQGNQLQGIETMRRLGEHEALVRDLEGAVSSAPFWLDAHRIVAESLLALGSRYVLAMEAVIEMTGAFVQRLPTIVELTFADGTPFADPATRVWLEQHTSQPGNAQTSAVADGLGDLAAEVRDLIGAGKKAEALDKLAAARSAAQGERALFDLQVLQVQICLDLDLPSVALPLLQHLEAEVERRALDTWEPALAVRTAGLALRAYRHPAAEKLLGDTTLRTAMAATQQRLTRLDLRTAVRLIHA
ncbi:type VI secretion system protein TssA [Aquabacter sp. CN5-332]|uniref:type VI secretion system protein TssA n=1 Tax=Aquabacter sp. CN5-332 TaxID=3156608 RepID=UPI0032B49D34